MDTLLYLFAALVLAVFLSIMVPVFFGAVWWPTPYSDIRRLLSEAGLKEGETLYDLGCGDGRVLITAAREFGAKGVGVEIDPFKAAIARFRIRLAGLSDRITVIRSSALSASLSGADVVFMYLSHQAGDRLAEKMMAELKPHARVVSYGFMVPGLELVKADRSRKAFVYSSGLGRNLDRYT